MPGHGVSTWVGSYRQRADSALEKGQVGCGQQGQWRVTTPTLWGSNPATTHPRCQMQSYSLMFVLPVSILLGSHSCLPSMALFLSFGMGTLTLCHCLLESCHLLPQPPQGVTGKICLSLRGDLGFGTAMGTLGHGVSAFCIVRWT